MWILSLAWTDTVTASPLKCYGEASCYKIQNATSDTIYCHGFRSCLELEGRHNTYVGTAGVLSLKNTILYDPFDVYSRGFYSGYNATIYCAYDKLCNIYCYSNGCQNLHLVCVGINNYTQCNSDTNYMYFISCDETEGVICPMYLF